MQVLKKLKLYDALSNPEMKRIQGGVDLKEYCCTLWNICWVWGNDCPEDGAFYGMGICINGGWHPSDC